MAPRIPRSGTAADDPKRPGLFVVGFAVIFGLVLFLAAMTVVTHAP